MFVHRLRTRKSALATAALLALGTAPVQQSQAAACAFTPSSGNWNIAANWNCGIVPSGPAADSATVAAGKTVTVNDARSIFTFSNAGGLNLDASTFSLQAGGSTTNTGTINVGGPSTAALQMSHSIANTGGVIQIANGSVLNQFNGAITGGSVNTTGTGALTVFSSSGNFLNGVTLGGRMDMASNGNSRQRVTGGLTLANGSVDLNANGILSFEGTQSVGGTGSIVFGTTGSGNRIDLDGFGTTTFGSGVTVRGHSGTIGQEINLGGTQTLLNQGTISADVAGGTITLAGSAVTNQGTLSAMNGGTLVLSSNVTGSGAGQITAGTGSTVLQNGVTLAGTINTSGTGLFSVNGSSFNFLNGVTFNGNMDMTSIANSRQRVTAGGLVLNGTINLNSNGNLSFEGDGSFGGNATVVFGSTGAGNRIDLDSNGTTTFGANTVVRGHSGTIGQQINIGGTQTLVNNGLISADVSGGTINITDSAVVNNGILQAINGGTLVLSSNVTGGVGGQIVAGAGSQVVQSGVTISGTVNTSGSGLFSANSSSTNYLNGVTLNGQLDMATFNNSRERVIGGLTFAGSSGINLNANGILSFEGTQSVGGTGSIVFGTTGSGNRIDLDGFGTTTFGSGVTVRGHSGTIGQEINLGGTQTLLNQGTISADVAGGTITLAGSAVTNQGTLSAMNGGTLVLSSSVTGVSGGQIMAGTGSTVLQNGVTLAGTINTSGNGLFSVTGSSFNFLNGVTFTGNMDMASIANSRQRVTPGGLVLNGTITLNNNGNLSFEGDGSFGGNATVVFGSTGAGNRIDLDSNGTTTFGANTVVRGHSGTIGQQINIGGTQTLVNNGLISADVSGGTIHISESSVVNNSILKATNGGVLSLNSAVSQSGAGVILADNGTVVQNGVRITGGTIASANGGTLLVASTSANFMDATTVTGVVDMATVANSRLRVNNGLTLNGRLDLNSNGILSFEGTQSLSGTGAIVFGSTGSGNRIDLDGDGTTTIAAGTTIRGHSGTIGNQINIGGTQTLVNNGTINAELAGGTLTFTDSALVNHGLLRAQAGTMNVGVPLSGTGTLQVDATGVMNLPTGAKAQGVLAMGGSGAVLNLSTGNLTLSTDYTNAGAGTGNSFNRRAGVSGAGQIVAGGDVSQRITGANITNGNTPNATLTIGNVRVGSTTFDYQVGNAGTIGPTLRGAIQTNVNGANLTDARLSGLGVTAANYLAGTPGQNSGDLGVTFTAASAGALAPLSGQVLNLRSNFENIADQKLNIVLGSGAAAYNAAVGSAASPVVLPNQRIGGTATAPVAVANTAAPGTFSEDLNVSLGGASGAATASGSISGRVAGTNNTGTGAINVGLNTSSAGALNGSVTLNYQTAGAVNGTSNGLGTASVGSQAVAVQGNVYQAAAGQLVGNVLNFGTVQVGQSVSQNLVVRNTATGPSGFVEDLNVSFGPITGSQGTGLIQTSGSLNGIVGGATSNGSNGTMTVGVNTSAAGTVSGSVQINYTSAGAVGGVSNGLGTLAVGSEGFGVSGTIQAQGTVVNQASPVINNAVINLGAVRVGDAAPGTTVSVTNQATVAPQAALNASIATGGSPFTAAGSFNLLNPGATNNGSLQVGMSTGTAGTFNGSATLALVSDASNIGGCAPNCQLTLPNQQVSLSGKVYAPAVGQVATTVVDFGTVRVGDTPSARNITINNTAAVAGLNDTLRGDLTGVSGPFSHSGSVSGIAAQGSGTIAVNLSTTAAGVYNQTGSVGLLSQNGDMSDVSAGAAGQVIVKGQVNRLANADFDLLSGLGTLTENNGHYVLTLNALQVGNAATWLLQLDNDVAGPADHLRGTYDLAGADEFGLTGFGAVSDLAAGQIQSGLTLSFSAVAAGDYEDTIVFNGFGFNDSDTAGLAQQRTLTVRLHVDEAGGGGGNVPEPATALLVLAGLAAATRRARRTQPLEHA